MTSETEALKTNEFLRRRKLRIQQVREQSKEIAKKIRQRAKAEKFRHIVDLDEKKQKEYFEHQDKLIKKLEHYYANGLRSVGAGHKNASDVNLQDIPEKTDLSKKRGKEAAAELRQKKQEKLDKQKKLLDRKLQARETANEISREKSSTVASKLLAKSSSKVEDISKPSSDEAIEKTDRSSDQNIPSSLPVNQCDETDKPEAVTTDMATQWDVTKLPNEWEPQIPKLVLPKGDKDSPKETPHKHGDSKSEKNKRLNLFALSTDMPSSLRGGLSSVPEENIPVKSSVTLVSEYLQSRGLRLRESDTTVPSKRGVEDLQSIKQTILRTRSSRNDVKETNKEKTSKLTEPPSALTKKNSIMMYNHSTRDTRDILHGDRRLVIRDPQTDEDAYSQAMKESSSDNNKEKEYQNKLQDMRNKIAMTKQNVEKEYKDTMAFLSSLPKDKSKPIKNAYMDDQRQKMQKESRQWKLQQEFKKIEKDCRRNSHNMKPRTSMHDESQNKSKSPSKCDSGDDFNDTDFQYSWMPVPDSDGSLAIHTIPTTLKDNTKSSNTVKFSKVDSYHEYRSRHRHTPPTKDKVTHHEKNANKRVVEAIVIQQEDDESAESSSVASDTSSVPLKTDTKARRSKDREERLSDAERIIIYKILDSKVEKKDKGKKNSCLIKDYAKSLTSIDKERILKYINAAEENGEKTDTQKTPTMERISKNAETRVSFEQLNEGIYRTVNEKGDNINSLYVSDSPRGGDQPTGAYDANGQDRLCVCKKKLNREPQNVGVHCERGDEPSVARSQSTSDKQRKCTCGSMPNAAKLSESSKEVPQATESNSSFKTARTNKTNTLKEGEFIKLLDEGGQDAGKFYIGATGFLQDNAYEVVIQLRKKDIVKDIRIESETQVAEESMTPINVTKKGVKENPDTVPTTETADAYIMSRETMTNGDPLETESYSLHTQQVSEEPVDGNVMSQEPVIQSNRASSDMALEGQFIQTSSLVDKSVYTTTKLPYAVPSNVTKSDSAPRPATSTYTQTTGLGSPDRRPVFLHMSSSTSTTYMSPPELILPHFLKDDYKISYDEIYNLTQNVQGNRMRVVDEKQYCEEYAGCRCRRCTHSRKLFLSKIKSPPRMNSSPRIKLINNRGNTPPNTAKSYITESEKTGSMKSVPKTRKCKCPNCERRSRSKMCLKTHNHKSKRHLVTNRRSSRNLAMRININKKGASSDNNIRKVTLNPVIKSYVDKLLALNKEGLKAVKVMNQNCSSATTPGSSIIDDPHNIDRTKPMLENKISLEQIKAILTQQLLEEFEERKNSEQSDMDRMEYGNGKRFTRNPRKKLHKVKSLNISKHLKTKSSNMHEHVHNVKYRETVSSSSSTNTKPNSKKSMPPMTAMTKSRSKSSQSPRKSYNEVKSKNPLSTTALFTKDSGKNDNDNKTTTRSDSEVGLSFIAHKKKYETNYRPEPSLPTRRAAVTISESEATDLPVQCHERPLIASTQTNVIIDEEIKFMKLAEDKLQNMEKIADLTEKCTKRLSNLAKVLEEVRRNKSLAYSQISDSASDSDRRSDRYVASNKLPAQSSIFEIRKDSSIEHEKTDTTQNQPLTQSSDSIFEIKNKTSSESRKSANAQLNPIEINPITAPGNLNEDGSLEKNIEVKTPTDAGEPQKSPYDLLDMKKEMADGDRRSDINLRSKPSGQSYEPLQTKKADGTKTPPQTPKGKPEKLKEYNPSNSPEYVSYLTDIPTPHTSKSHMLSNTQAAVSNILSEEHNVRSRGKPPPALTRIHIKNGNDYIVPHELSTVVEVDSPLSIKLKNRSARNELTASNSLTNSSKEVKKSEENNPQVNPDLLQSNLTLSRRQKVSSTDSSEDSKMQMMDLKQFNEIMLKPFISLQEYARQSNVSTLDDGSNIDNLPKDDEVNDELSSLHSDGSLPDVIAELLKRNIISEPFKFESGSNVNSSTVSSESTLSVLALSKMRKGKTKTSVMSQNKENIAETSDTLSVSSNPDLENAFKKLGMGWASSTLKKTKERLALSSSSNTSSSSMTQFKIKGFNNQNIPVLVSDSVSSALNTSPQRKPAADTPKNAEQQTSLVNSMTVKEFLTNELAKKITFTNRSRRNETEEEFVSLYETKMPEEMKQMVREERSMDSGPSGSNNRARTSTPVQIFKSLTYHSSSSSNISNGLFSNADELSSVKGTSTSMRNHSTSDKDDLTIPNYSLRMRKGLSDCSKSD